MPSRRRFIAASATAALAASVLPRVDAEEGGRAEGPSGNGDIAASRPTTGAERAGAEDSARALRRARSRASAGQSVPFPAP